MKYCRFCYKILDKVDWAWNDHSQCWLNWNAAVRRGIK